jgi:hypothetical protein
MVLQNDGSGNFSLTQKINEGYQASDSKLADFDHDGTAQGRHKDGAGSWGEPKRVGLVTRYPEKKRKNRSAHSGSIKNIISSAAATLPD